MKNSAGLILIKDNKILLCHPTNASWKGTYSFPKGHIEFGESNIAAAIRETQEETGLIIPKELINPKEYEIIYKDKSGKTYKKVYYYIVNVDNLCIPEILPKDKLQIDEVDYAIFLTKQDAKTKIFWRFIRILDHIND